MRFKKYFAYLLSSAGFEPTSVKSVSCCPYKKWHFKQRFQFFLDIETYKTEVCVARQSLWWFDLIISATQQAKSFKLKNLSHVRSTWATGPPLVKALVRSILLERAWLIIFRVHLLHSFLYEYMVFHLKCEKMQPFYFYGEEGKSWKCLKTHFAKKNAILYEK